MTYANPKMIYGFDPGFRHGAMTLSSLATNDEGNLAILAVARPFVWKEKSGLGISEQAAPHEIFSFSEDIVRTLSQLVKGPVVIDWDPYSVFWRSRKVQSVILGVFIGYISGSLAHRGYYPIVLNPTSVREYFRLPPRAKKEDVHAHFFREARLTELGHDELKALENQDVLDSVILSYVGYQLGV